MGAQASTRLPASDYRFLLRRLEDALLGRDPALARAQVVSLTLGCVVAVLAVVSCAALSVLRPQPELGSARIAVGQPSGALYARVGDVWHPVLNLASARLIAAAAEDPVPVPDSVLTRTERGALLGIPGAPQFLGQPLTIGESGWTVCDGRRGLGTTVLVGPVGSGGVRRLPPDRALLVATSSNSPAYLLFGGRRALVDLTDPAVLSTLAPPPGGPHIVSKTLLAAVPETRPVTAPVVTADDSTVCAQWRPARSGAADIEFLAGDGPAAGHAVMLAQADGAGPEVDAVALPQGRSAYVLARGVTGAGIGTRYFVNETGVRFPVSDDGAAEVLGLASLAVPAPWPVLAALPCGPELSSQAASVVRDTIGTHPS
ncbi:type VII secretion protein EccB [Mycobacterium sp.]|uniref:type VII secretion protein EccB n=1 Tax=Mycobacterium sp. TaxID=1785 RepID=UPI003A834FFE